MKPCHECDGRAQVIALIAPDPEYKRILKPQKQACPTCHGLGVISASQQD